MSSFWRLFKTPEQASPQKAPHGASAGLDIVPMGSLDDDVNDEPAGEQLIPSDTNSQRFTKKVTRQEQVPYVRRVKVPIKAKKIVDTMYTVKVKSKASMEVPQFEEVEETYVDVEEVTATRQKEVWVKKVVNEEYTTLVPVEKTRRVRRKSMRVEEHEVEKDVQVPGTKIIEIDAYRIDEIDDWKTVEYEEEEEYEMVPRKISAVAGRTVLRELPAPEGEEKRSQRRYGSTVYFDGDDEVDLDALEEEEDDGAAGDIYTEREIDSIPQKKRSRRARASSARKKSKRSRKSYGGEEGEPSTPKAPSTGRRRVLRSAVKPRR